MRKLIKRFLIPFLILVFSFPVFAKDVDMAGSAVFCTPKRVTQLTDKVAPQPETMMSYYFYVKKDQSFCWSVGDDPKACENPKAFVKFGASAPDGMHFDNDYYYAIDDPWGQLRILRSGKQYYDIDAKFKTHGYCKKIKDLN